MRAFVLALHYPNFFSSILGVKLPRITSTLNPLLPTRRKKLHPSKKTLRGAAGYVNFNLEIAKTYYEISKEDYIARLVEKQRKTVNTEKENGMTNRYNLRKSSPFIRSFFQI